MNLTNQPLYRDKSFWAIIIAAIVFTGIFVLIDQKQLALGTLTGSAVGAFNYWLVYDAIRKSKSLTNSKANKLIMVRHLIRMVLAVAVLLLGMKVGTYFIIGVLIGLFFQLGTYFADIWSLLKKKA